MITFLARRLIQMAVVIVLSAAVSYALLYIAPGGPVSSLLAENANDDIRQEDILRIKARYELDLWLPVRFSRWFAGLPRGSLRIGEQAFFGQVQVGCAQPGLVRLRYPDGREELVEEGCAQPVLLADLEGRRVSRGVLFGDFGLSQTIARDRPISGLIASRLPYTLTLMSISILLSLLIAIPLGVYSAVRQYSRFDTVITAITFVGASLPSFFFAILAILVFSILAKEAGLPYLPPGNAEANRDYVVPLLGMVYAGSALDRLLHFILPCAVLTFISIAGWSRFVRSSMLEVLGLDYIRTARAKGVRERAVVLRHALRNALLPFITLLAGLLPALFGGAAITEAVFNWPGLGRLLLDALGRSDYAVALALLYISIVLQMIGYLLSDIMYTVADPRIKLT